MDRDAEEVRPTDTEQVPDEASADAPEKEQELEHWWQADGFPWNKRKPERADIVCMGLIFFVAVYSLVMLPLQPVLLGFTPYLLAALGYRTGIVMIGALAATGDPWWPLLALVGSVMMLKFDWIYWWAGKLWGHGLIEVWSGRSERARRRNQRAIAFTQRFESLAIFVTYLPIPMPAAVVYAALGAAGTRLSKFLIVSFVSSLITSGLYLYLGWTIGEPAVELINQYGQVLWYVSIAILVGMIGVAWWKARQPKSDEPPVPGPAI